MSPSTRYALLSVTDKTGVVEFAVRLAERGYRILSTGGTARVLREGGVEVQDVADFTGFPEILDGRVKTLHPKVHGGLLARRDDPAHLAAMADHGIEAIDVVAVNLYRFREAAAKPGATADEIVEQIDIGGPSMIRSAAKNHAHVAVVVDPADYQAVLDGMAGEGAADMRRRLAAKAFTHTAEYDTAISKWFLSGGNAAAVARASGASARFPAGLSIGGSKIADLRYGENPHQFAALYGDEGVDGPHLARAEQIGGKELSYNNLVDLDAALMLCLEFDEPACVVIKHATPCGVATAQNPRLAVEAAFAADPVSAYGGILAVNRPLDASMANVMVEQGTFVEAIVAPRIEPAAVQALQQKKWGFNVRLLELRGWPDPSAAAVAARRIHGGYLMQTQDVRRKLDDLRWKTQIEVSSADERTMRFAWAVCKHVRSNAIVLAHQPGPGVIATSGIGGGQTSRVDAVKIAVAKARERAKGSVMASDAFFPFADGVEAAARAGVVGCIQPGGSKRDDEVVEAAKKAGMAMAFTGVRHFRH